jgi:hypothetical protein
MLRALRRLHWWPPTSVSKFDLSSPRLYDRLTPVSIAKLREWETTLSNIQLKDDAMAKQSRSKAKKKKGAL